MSFTGLGQWKTSHSQDLFTHRLLSEGQPSTLSHCGCLQTMREISRYCEGSIAYQASEPDRANAMPKEKRQMDWLLSGESQCKCLAILC